MKKNSIYLLVSIITIIIIFLSDVTIDFMSQKDLRLRYRDSINLKVNKIRHRKGITTLEDSVAISENCPLIINRQKGKFKVDYSNTIGSLPRPYSIFKNANSNVIRIIIASDTMYYKSLY